MQKNIAASYGGMNSTVGDLLVNRLLPNRYVQAVGPFVFLDHVYPVEYASKTPKTPDGDFAHPHRGIATLSYVLSGGLEHFDSRGHHGIVSAGGLQWMKAGNGIIHDEQLSPVFQEKGGVLHSLQFWINLPAAQKAEAPEYLNVAAEDIPEIALPDNAGTLRVLAGSLGDQTSPVRTYSRELLYHIRLRPKSSFSLDVAAGLEYAAFVPSGEVIINGQGYGNSELVVFGEGGQPGSQGVDVSQGAEGAQGAEGSQGMGSGLPATGISFSCSNIKGADVFLFGGAPYLEPIVAQGPFVMNSHKEISQAYQDFFAGKYGAIGYEA